LHRPNYKENIGLPNLVLKLGLPALLKVPEESHKGTKTQSLLYKWASNNWAILIVWFYSKVFL
jgi:hypothetical protein